MNFVPQSLNTKPGQVAHEGVDLNGPEVSPCNRLKRLARITKSLPRGSIAVPLWGSYLESYKVIPNGNYYGAFG